MHIPSLIFSFLLVFSLSDFLVSGVLTLSPEDSANSCLFNWSVSALLAFGLYFLWSLAPHSLIRKLPYGYSLELSRLERRLSLYPWVFLLAYVLLLLSSFRERPFTFLGSSGFSGLELPLWLCLGGVLSLIGCFFYSRVYRLRQVAEDAAPWVLGILLFVLLSLFLFYARGRLIFSDDHPSFLYRLQLLEQHFPWIPFYNVDWNAGYSAREFFASGVLNVFFLSWPLLKLFSGFKSLESSFAYTLLIPYLYIFLIPCSVYFAARVLNFSKRSSFLSAVLSLAPSMSHFEWLLQYGTLGFSLSAGLMPLTLALAMRLALDDREPAWSTPLLLLVVSFFCLSWPLAGVAFLPLALYALVQMAIRPEKSRLAKVVVFAVLFGLANGPWISTFVRESKVGTFLSGDQLPGSTVKSFHRQSGAVSKIEKHSLSTRAGLQLRRSLVKVNPLLVLFSFFGLCFVSQRRLAFGFLLTLAWLLLLTSIGEEYKPQLELRRMMVPASFIMSLLAGVGLSSALGKFWRELEDNSGSKSYRLATAVCLFALSGAVFLTPLISGATYLNRSAVKYTFAPPELESLSRAIAKHGGEGRTFFLGFILHELGAKNYASQDGGHIAPIPTFSGKSLYASHFYHARWSSVDPIPESYRKRGEAGIEEFLDLVNATAVVTYKREWAKYCGSKEYYKQVIKVGRFRLFVRKRKNSSYFLKGKGILEAATEGITVKPETSEVVLKFRYLPQLRVSPPESAEISPEFAFNEDLGGGKTQDVDFIRLIFSEKALVEEITIKIGFWP